MFPFFDCYSYAIVVDDAAFFVELSPTPMSKFFLCMSLVIFSVICFCHKGAMPLILKVCKAQHE